MRTSLPFATKDWRSSSTRIVPLKAPCTESRRSKLARLTRSLAAPPLRTTTARRRRLSPPSVFAIKMRAISRPILPNPYSTTSTGRSTGRCSESIRKSNSRFTYSSRESPSPCALSKYCTARRPTSMWLGPKDRSFMMSRTGAVSNSESSLRSICRT